MKGWTPDGTEVELLPFQEQAVRALLDPQLRRSAVLPRGRAGGWSTIVHTVLRYDNLARGVPLDDPVYRLLASASTPEGSLLPLPGPGEVVHYVPPIDGATGGGPCQEVVIIGLREPPDDIFADLADETRRYQHITVRTGYGYWGADMFRGHLGNSWHPVTRCEQPAPAGETVAAPESS